MVKLSLTKNKIFKNLEVIIPLAVLLLIIFFNAVHEQIPVKKGLGWDGGFFYDFAINLDHKIFNKSIDGYRVQRIFPSFLVWIFNSIFQIHPSVENVKQAFLILNCFTIFISFFVWNKLIDKFNFSVKVKLISFIFLFFNFAILKMPFYYPILTDSMAFLLGILLLYFYISDNNFGLFLTTFFGSFTFPTLLYVGIIFMVWPFNLKFEFSKTPFKLNSILVTLGALVFLGLILVLFFKGYHLQYNPEVEINRVNGNLLIPSIILVLLYVVLLIKHFVYFDLISFFRTQIILKRVLIVIGMMAIIKIALNLISNGDVNFSLVTFLVSILLQSVTNPLVFLVSHIIYFGPFILLFIFLYDKIIFSLSKMGIGLYFTFVFYLLLGVGSESRQFINALPIFVFIICYYLNNININWYWVSFFGFLTIIYSRFWFSINQGKFSGSNLSFPKQFYFMNHGPWMSNTMYFIWFSIILITGWAIWIFLKRNNFLSKQVLI